MAWLIFALLTVVSWGVYGVFLHSGQMAMADPANGRYKAFLFVGIAYFITAVIAPLLILWLKKDVSWEFPKSGMTWSLLAGIVGAIGAFCVLLAFGFGGMPSVVMSIIFAGAPVVNAIVALSLHGGWEKVNWQFMTGIILAAIGGCMVAYYKPPPSKAKPKTPQIEQQSAKL